MSMVIEYHTNSANTPRMVPYNVVCIPSVAVSLELNEFCFFAEGKTFFLVGNHVKSFRFS